MRDGTFRARTPAIAVAIGGTAAFSIPVRRNRPWGLPGVGAGGSSAIAVVPVAYGEGIDVARPLQQRSAVLPVVWRALGRRAGFDRAARDAGADRRAVVDAIVAGRPCAGVSGDGRCECGDGDGGRRLGTTRASATTFLIPVVALRLGAAVRGESGRARFRGSGVELQNEPVDRGAAERSGNG